MRKQAMTLIELIVALMLVTVIITIVSASLVFFVNQIQANLEKSNINNQMSYALEDIRMRCVSAVALGAYFNAGETKNELIIEGERDPYIVTLNDTTDNYMYKYYRANPDPLDATKMDLVVKTCTNATDLANHTCNAGNEEILIEKKFKPGIDFNYTIDPITGIPPPELLEVVLTAQSSKVPLGGSSVVTKYGGIRFWFIDAAA